MTDGNWEFLVGFSAMIFAVYPMAKDVINKEPNSIVAIIMSMGFAAILTIGFLFLIKKIKKS